MSDDTTISNDPTEHDPTGKTGIPGIFGPTPMTLGIPAPEMPPGRPTVYVPAVLPALITNLVWARTSAQYGMVQQRVQNNSNIGEDTVDTFIVMVHHVMLQNNSNFAIGWEIDAPASAGSPQLQPGQTVFLDVGCLEVHIFTAQALPINGGATGNIVIRGWQ
jgi:hypothetical protein